MLAQRTTATKDHFLASAVLDQVALTAALPA